MNQDNNAGSPSASNPRDHVLSALLGLADSLTSERQTAEEIRTDVVNLLNSMIPDPPAEDGCENPDAAIAPVCAQRKLNIATADHAFNSAEQVVGAQFGSAVSAWKLALTQYTFSLVQAESLLRTAVKIARDDFQQKETQDSPERNLFLYFQMKAEVTSALVSYETSLADAGATLSGAGGTLTAAYVAYATAVAASAAGWLDSQAVAFRSFWQSVESARNQ
jgi:hypothetical protein